MHCSSGVLPPPQTSRSATQPEVSLREGSKGFFSLALTILTHPCLARIGEQALLPDLGRPQGRVDITRRGPLFGRPRDAQKLPLSDPYLSRSRPLVVTRRSDDEVLLDASKCKGTVWVEGRVLTTTQVVTPADLKKGIVLMLSRRVVLLLHEESPVAPLVEDNLGLVGESAAMIRARNTIVDTARDRKPVLIRGQSGTGKELVARAVHQLSGRHPFVPVNLSAYPSTLAAAELFGAEKGAFDGAREGRKGDFRKAHKGTLFIDELGDIPLEVQPMLFRVLEDQKVRPLGTETLHQVDVRFIAATDRDLERAIAEGVFRPQLLYRLRGHEILLPPVQERRQDLGLLLVHLLSSELESKAQRLDLRSEENPWLPAEMVADLALHPMPGNVRFLATIAQKLVNLAQRSAWNTDPKIFVTEIDEFMNRTQESAYCAENPSTEPTAMKRSAAEIPCDELIAALEMAGGSASGAAKRLGIGRSSFYKQWGERCGLQTSESLSDETLIEAHRLCSGDVTQIALRLQVPKQGLFKRLKRLGLR